jgi:lactoylglutathione lyase
MSAEKNVEPEGAHSGSGEAEEAPKFGYVIVYVESVVETLEFYERAFGLRRKFITPVGDYGELLTGSTAIAFASEKLGEDNGLHFRKNSRRSPGGEEQVPFAAELGFIVADVDAAVAKAIRHGAKLAVATQKKSWGQVVAYVLDINNVLVELCTEMK